MITSSLVISIIGPEAKDVEVDTVCARTKQDATRRKSCPAGQVSMITAIKKIAGFNVVDENEPPDGVFTMPIFIQDRSTYQSSLSASYGTLSEPTLTTKSNLVVIKIAAADAVDSGLDGTPYKIDIRAKVLAETELDPDTIRTVKTAGQLFSNAGKKIYSTGAALPLVSGEILLTERVNGNISISYVVTGFELQLEIAPREDQDDNNYQSTLYVSSSCGQVLSFAVDVPVCWPRNHASIGDRPSDGDVDITDPPPEAKPKDLSLTWDTCSFVLVGGDTDFFDNLPGSGPIYFPGTRRNPGCASG